MKVVITGGTGFVGLQLCKQILRRGALLCGSDGRGKEAVERIVLFDAVAPADLSHVPTDRRVEIQIGDVTCKETIAKLVDTDNVSVFHLASIMSGQGEEQFDTCLQINLEGTQNLLEACRARSRAPRFVFASSAAAFGRAGPGGEAVSDSTHCVPATTYGTTKAICELLVNDYTRKGFVEGRSARLANVLVRPGVPNGASTGAFSSVVREMMAGRDFVSPLDPDLTHPIMGHRTAAGCLLHLHESPGEPMGVDKAFTLPSRTTTQRELEEAVKRIAQQLNRRIGTVRYEVNDKLNSIVASMPRTTDGSRIVSLGAPRDLSIEDVVRAYCEDYLGVDPALAPKKPRVGFIGLGNMGLGMATNVAKAGYDIAVYNRTEEKAKAFAASVAGLSYVERPVTVASSAAAVGESCDVVLSCLANQSAAEEQLLGGNGALAAMKPGSVCVDHATVSPAFSRACREAADARNVGFLDAPISGGPEGARAGTLSIMVGGEATHFARAQPVFESMGRHVVRIGGSGTGTAAKLVNQLLVGVHSIGAAEALAFGKYLGVPDTRKLLELLAASWGNSRILQRVGSVYADSVDGKTEGLMDSKAPMRNLLKDLSIILNSANDTQLRKLLLSTEVAHSHYTQLVKQGYGAADMALVAMILADVASAEKDESAQEQ